VVAALSDALLLIEAPERSGAISTANRANDMGKTVFVVPGSIAQPSFKGSHDLIRHGAILVDHPDQVLDDMGWLTNTSSGIGDQNLPEIQQRILGLLGAEPMATERIAVQLGLDPAQVMSEITMLELEGRVIRGSGGITLAP
jgi:DNA processing protein